MIREKLQEFVMILIKKYHYNFPVEYFNEYHVSFNKGEFLGVEQPKEETRLQTTDSLPTLDFGQKKKHSDRGSSDQKDGCNIESNFGGKKHNLEKNYIDQVDRATNQKEPTDLFEGEVHVEKYLDKYEEKEATGFLAWNQEKPTKNSVNIKDVAAGIKANLSMIT